MPAKRTKLDWVKPEELSLDSDNPRLPDDLDRTQPAILKYMVLEESLDELADSISRNGFFVQEPMVTIPKGDKLIVVEGNRRLSTIRLLLSETLRRKHALEHWPELDKDIIDQLESLPIVKYHSRSEVMAFIGFRHITGIKRWGYFARSRYIGQMMKAGHEMEQIEREIGDISGEVRRLYQVSVVYDQMLDSGNIDHDAVRKEASLLEVALARKTIKTFLSIPARLPVEIVETVVPHDKIDELEEVSSYIFGNAENNEKPVIRESREITSLGRVLENDEARTHLRKTRNLTSALDYIDGEYDFLLRKLNTALNAVRDVNSVLPAHRDEKEISDLLTQLKTFVKNM